MTRIHVLSQEVQNQIAAGEVVERPASVLKELVENSLDAGADWVRAEIESGGQGRIMVQDNGTGLAPEELPLALERHATSKIRSIEELLSIASFGFRGEALPSIASVSRMRLASITPGSAEGTEAVVEFGAVKEQGPAALREGTRVEVTDLFVNTPARLKFLKAQTTEARKCQEAMQRIGLAHLDAAFEFVSGGRTVFAFPGGQRLHDRVAAIWPPRIAEHLVPVGVDRDGYSVRGLIGRPDTAQGTPQRILFYVNGRPVQDRLLMSALRQAYKGRLLSREYPQAVLFFTVPGRDVDVNVHPAKSEVRFRNEGAIYSLVAEAVEKGLEDEATSAGAEGKETSPGGSPADREPRYKFRGLEELQREAVRETPPEPDYRAESTGSAGTAPPSSGTLHGPRVAASREEPGVTLGPGRLFLGQVASAYLLVDDSDRGLLIVDQHAAHERVLFHGFRQQGPGQTQLLAPPREIALHPSEKGALQKCADLLRRLGFAFDWDGGDTVTLRGVPAHLEPSRGAELLRDVLGERTDTMDGLWTVLACKKAVKAGEDLSRDEAAHLLEQWLQTPDRDYCPHGRPVAVRLQESDLERMFKRRR